MNKDVNEKICIVGGGPSGISVAWFLEKKGYKNVHVLEKNERVGGKCNSPMYKGKTYEMGAALGVKNYEIINSIIAELNIESKGPVTERIFCNNKTGKEYEFLTKEENEEFKNQYIKLVNILQEKYPLYKKPGHANCYPELMETFKDFCEKNGLDILIKVWKNPTTSYGYDYLEITPAAYVLKYLSPDIMKDFLSFDITLWNQGTEGLWREIGEALVNKPRLGINIGKIIRKNNKVYVYTNWGKEEFDKIIFTSPLQELPSYLDVREEEEELLKKIKVMDYKTYACLVKEPRPHKSVYVPENMNPERAGHVMFCYDRWIEDTSAPIIFYILANPQEKITEEDCIRNLISDAKLFGFEITDIIHSKTWKYFPHISCEIMKTGWYDKLEAMQGKDNVYYAGEIMNFSDMEECAAYSKDLVERFF